MHCASCIVQNVHEFFLKIIFVSCCVNAMASTWSVKHEVTNTMLPFFFKSSCNSDDAFPLVILPKFKTMSSSEANLRGSKVESNLKSRCNNPIVQLVCLSVLLTFILVVAPNLSKIQVFPN
jgi:hypothetical protein